MNRFTKLLAVALVLLASGCATPNEATTAGRTGVERECDFTAEHIEQIRSRVFEFLLAEWPVLDAQCEGIANSVETRPDGDCAILGGPVMNDGCPTPSHRGYVITFDELTLTPKNVFWLAAD